jgi:hypothetical protein
MDPALSVPPKTSPRARNLETRLDALGNVENVSVSEKFETRPGTLCAAEKEFRSTILENWT